MTKDEIRKRIAEIKKQIADNDFIINQDDILQYALKIAINSAYGAISSANNPIGDTDLANAITMMGSTSIKEVNVIAIRFVQNFLIKSYNDKLANLDKGISDYSRKIYWLQNKIKELEEGTADELKQVIVANDTDSTMLDLSMCEVDMFDGDIVTPAGYKLVQDCDDYINSEFDAWYKRVTGTHDNRLNFKREKICDGGIYLKKANANVEAKKNYVLHILDNEGVTHPKFKYTGVKFARSVIPAKLKEAGKNIVEHMILTRDRISTDEMVVKLFDDYKAMPLEDRSIVQRCKDMQKYAKKLGDPWQLRTPGHIKAAIAYNEMLDILGLKKYEKIKSGDTAKIVFLKPNKYDIERIAYLDAWPEEFNDIFEINDEVLFEKTIYDEIKRFYFSADWPAFNPAQNYELNLATLLSM